MQMDRSRNTLTQKFWTDVTVEPFDFLYTELERRIMWTPWFGRQRAQKVVRSLTCIIHYPLSNLYYLL